MKEKARKNETTEANEELKAELEKDILVVQEATHVKDGIHDGKINNVVHENRTGFDYIDIYVDIEDEKGNAMTIKTGFPAYVSSNSGFGRFLVEAGIRYEPGDKLKLSVLKGELCGREISFQTYTEDNFARVINKTIKFN